MAHFTVRLPDRLAAAFDAMAATEGGRSRALRRLMERALKGVAPSEANDEDVAPRGKSEKVTLRLKPAELSALDDVSAAAGLKRTEWASACLRGRLLAKPSFNRSETDALVETRQELARISSNLRELVRTVREGDTPTAELAEALASVERFRVEVREQLVEIRDAVEARAGYWVIRA
jgi:hypothetical protein